MLSSLVRNFDAYVCLDVDHRLLLVIGERSSRPMKEFLRVRCKWGMEREWQREWTDLLSRSIQALEICNTLCLLWTARAHDVITRLMNEFLRSLFYIHIYIYKRILFIWLLSYEEEDFRIFFLLFNCWNDQSESFIYTFKNIFWIILSNMIASMFI